MAATTTQVQAAQDLLDCRPQVFPLRPGQPRLCLVHADHALSAWGVRGCHLAAAVADAVLNTTGADVGATPPSSPRP